MNSRTFLRLTTILAAIFVSAPLHAETQGNQAMDNAKIVSTVETNNKAVSMGDLDGALATFEAGAVMLAQPGMPVAGTPALRAAFEQFLAIKPNVTVTGQETIQAGDIALHSFTWKMAAQAPDGTAIQQDGFSTVVLRKQADGRWLMVIDNPFADALLKKN
jgi:uncharacterized protein (TIGR02246 family)